MNMTTEAINPIKLLSAKEVATTIGMSKSWIYDQIKKDKFPKPVRLGPQKTAWKLTDIADWVNTLPKEAVH
jgi:prophage regulatory protein